MRTSGSSDSEVNDGFHGGGKTYLRILMAILKQVSRLNSVTNAYRLAVDLKRSPIRYSVYR